MRNYIALAEKGKSEYWAVFPDFPGCVSCGKDYEELYKNCIEALSLHIDGMKDDNEKIPQPSTLEEIKKNGKDWCNVDGALILSVPCLSNQHKYVKINIDIPEALLNKIDSVAKDRSAFLIDVSERYLADKLYQ